MKTLIILTILTLYILQLEATPLEIKTTKVPIGTRLGKAKECIKVRAQEMKPEIRGGPDDCQYWIDMVNSIERNRITMLDKLLEMCNKAEGISLDQVPPLDLKEKLKKMKDSCDKFSDHDCPANLQNLEAMLDTLPYPYLQPTPHLPPQADPFDKHYKSWKKCVEKI